MIRIKIIAVEILVLIYCCDGQPASDENVIKSEPIISLREILHRVKRGGGGGAIPFRPLLVYRHQQKKLQEKWKKIEAEKTQKQEQLISYQQYQETIKEQQPWYQSHPTTHYSPSPQYSPYNNPTQYTSYSFPSYYFGRNEYPIYDNDYY